MTHCWETLLSKYMYSQYGQLIVQKKQRLYSRGQTILGDYLVKTTWQQVYMYLTQSRQNSHQCSADGLRCHWRLLSMLATFTMACAAYRIHQRASSSTASLSCDAICYIHSMAYVTSFILPLVLSSSSSTESRYWTHYGVRHLHRSARVPGSAATWILQGHNMIRWSPSQWRFFQPPRPSSRWLDVWQCQTDSSSSRCYCRSKNVTCTDLFTGVFA